MRTLKRFISVLSLGAGACLLAFAGEARAQTKFEGMALDRFDPAPPVDAFFGVPSPAIGGHLVLRAAVLFDYGHRPFVYDPATGSSIAVVGGQGTLRLDASLALWDRVLVSVDAPATLVQSGTDPGVANVDFHVPKSAHVGDLRVGLRGRIWGGFRDPFQIGVGGYLYAPTGSQDAYTGDGVVRGNFHLLLGGRAGKGVGVVWSATGGVTVRAKESALATFGGGAALVLGDDRVQLGPELSGAAQLSGNSETVQSTQVTVSRGVTMEILGGLKVRVVSGLFLGAAAGTSPLPALGSAPFRFVGGIAWAPLPAAEATRSSKVGDRDGDSIADDVDACPDVPGEMQSDPTKDGCPVADKDHDGIPDVDDACPNEPGPKSADATKNGCPPDADGDGIADARDACPKVPGVRHADPKKNGCPGDRDNDGVPDAEDACPDVPGARSADLKINGCPDDPDGDGIKGTADACPFEKGPADPDPKQNGCPKYVRVEKDEITISVQIHFKPNGFRKTETVDPVSEELMKEIRDVIVQHPEIIKIEVQGHTDDNGSEEYNQRLSQERADAVRSWLVGGGIPADKLVAKGYGFWKPVGDNRVNRGRGLNRRVQFVILERKK